jgi:hypothetical protein
MKSLLKNPLLQMLVISGLCVAGYFGLRSISVYNCTFLHASPPLRTSPTDDPEFCAVDNNSFIDLSRTRFAVQSSIQPTEKEGIWQIHLQTLSKRPISWDEIAITHTQKIHLLIIDDTLDIYHHVHPQPTETPGSYLFPFTPKPHHDYRLIAEFTPIRTQAQVIAESILDQAEDASATPHDDRQSIATTVKGNRLTQQHGEYQFELILPFSGLESGVDNEVLLRITNQGLPVPLEEIMGSYGHLVAFDREGKGFAHFHPILSSNDNPANTQPLHPSLPFSFRGMDAGDYRLWVQVKLAGEEHFVPFDFTVIP